MEWEVYVSGQRLSGSHRTHLPSKGNEPQDPRDISYACTSDGVNCAVSKIFIKGEAYGVDIRRIATDGSASEDNTPCECVSLFVDGTKTLNRGQTHRRCVWKTS
jgi:hypothetical protein